MTEEPKDVRYPDIMKALHELVEEPSDSVARIPIARIKKELAADGIDLAPHLEALKMRLAKMQAREELDRADQRRTRLDNKRKSWNPVQGISEMGKTLLEGFNGGTPQAALQGGFFRKLTAATDETRQAFGNDLELLKELEADDDVEA